MTFFGIVIVSILLVLISMNITYVPLKKLVKRASGSHLIPAS